MFKLRLLFPKEIHYLLPAHFSLDFEAHKMLVA